MYHISSDFNALLRVGQEELYADEQRVLRTLFVGYDYLEHPNSVKPDWWDTCPYDTTKGPLKRVVLGYF